MSPTSYQAAPPRRMIVREMERMRNSRAIVAEKGSGAESYRGAGLGLGGFFFAVLGGSSGLERAQQPLGNARYFGNRSVKRRLIALRRLGEAADLAHKLQRSSAHLF